MEGVPEAALPRLAMERSSTFGARVVRAILLVLTHTLSYMFTGFFFPGMWVVVAASGLISAIMLVTTGQDNSRPQAIILVACTFLAAEDLWVAWVCLTAHGMFVGGLVYSSPIVLLAAIASLYVAWRNITGNILQDKGKLAAYLMLLSHGACLLFGGISFPVNRSADDFSARARWIICAAGVLVSARFFTYNLDHRKSTTIATIACCAVVGVADLCVVWWCSTAIMGYYETPQWICVFPNLAAAAVSAFAAVTTFRCHRCAMASMQGAEMTALVREPLTSTDA